MPVKIVIREEVFVQGLPEYVKDLLKDDNQFANPKKIRELQMIKNCADKRKKNALQYRSRFTADDIVLWRESGDWLALPRGYFHEAMKIIDHHGIQAEVEDRTVCPEWLDPPQPTGTLFDYQNDALIELMKESNGTMEAPVGSGKTQIMLSAISRLKVPSLILVHTTELLRQTADRCQEWLNYKAGIYGAGKKIMKDITVGMVQTFIREKVNKNHPLYSRFGCVIQDECLSPETIIATPSGDRRLSDLSVGDEVCTPFGTSTRIVRIWRKVEEAFEFSYTHGLAMVASRNHEIWSRENVFRSYVDKLMPVGSAQSAFYCAQQYVKPAPINLEEYLIGWAYADGYCDPMGHQIKFSFSKPEKINLFRSVFFAICKEHTNGRGNGIFIVPYPYGEELRRKYSLHAGKKAHIVSIHPSLIESRSISVIRGLFDADGHRGRNAIVLTSVSKLCLDQVQSILSFYGIDSTVQSITKNKDHHNPKWNLTIYGDNINKYNSIIGWGMQSKDQGQFSREWKKLNLHKIDLLGVKPLGQHELIDIEIDHHDHLFLANRLVTSNCHHTPSTTFTEVLRRLPCKYKYGFTATPFRKDRTEKLIYRIIGPITSKVSHSDVEEAGRILWPDIISIPTQFFYPVQEALDWTKLISALVEDKSRNELICQTVRDRLHGYGLILTDRIEHANTLARLLNNYSPVLLTGQLTSNQRVDAMNKIRDGVALTIATVHVAGEGLSVNNWNMLFLVSPISGGSRTVQALGRITRPAPGKSRSILFDFIDARVPMLKAAAKARAKLYASKGEHNPSQRHDAPLPFSGVPGTH